MLMSVFLNDLLYGCELIITSASSWLNEMSVRYIFILFPLLVSVVCFLIYSVLRFMVDKL